MIGDRLVRRRAAAVAWQVGRLPGVLYALARELRSGANLHLAIASVAADVLLAGPGLRQMARTVAAGGSVVTELDRWAKELEHPDADLVRAVLATGSTTGGALAGALDRAAATLVERAELTREIRGLTAQPRTSAAVLTVSPLLFLLLVGAADRAVLGIVVTTGIGRVSFVVGIALGALGWWWMHCLATAVER